MSSNCMRLIRVCVLSSVCLTAVCTEATEAVWAKRNNNAYWSAADSWRDGYKPAAGGGDSVKFPTTSGSANAYLHFDEDASVPGLCFEQGTGGGTLAIDTTVPVHTMTIGAGGITSSVGNGTERLPHFRFPVYLAATQRWDLNFKGMENTDWLSYMTQNVSGPADVVWALSGGKTVFQSGSSVNFLGRTCLQTRIGLAGPSQFNRLGREVL